MLGATGSETGGGTQQAGRGSAAALNRMHRTRPGGHQVPLTQQSNHHRARGMSSSPAAVMQRRSQDRDSHCATRFAENQNTIAKIQWGRRTATNLPVQAAKTHNMPHWGARRARVRAPHQAKQKAQKVIKACIRGSQKRDRGTACGALRRVSRGTQGTPRPVFEYGTQTASAGRALPLTPTAPRCTCRSGTGPCRAPHG
jgi:hypothetical protein